MGQKTIKELSQEYKWMVKLGIDLGGYSIKGFIKQPNTQISSFKDNATAIKKLYNYKFKFKHDFNFLSLYEKIESYKFVKLNDYRND